jgi:hypothetical protein
MPFDATPILQQLASNTGQLSALHSEMSNIASCYTANTMQKDLTQVMQDSFAANAMLQQTATTAATQQWQDMARKYDASTELQATNMRTCFTEQQQTFTVDMANYLQEQQTQMSGLESRLESRLEALHQQQLQGFRDELIQHKLEFQQLLHITERQNLEISQLRSQREHTQATLLQRVCNLSQQEAVMILGNDNTPHLTHQNIQLKGYVQGYMPTRTPAAEAASSVTTVTPTRTAATTRLSPQNPTPANLNAYVQQQPPPIQNLQQNGLFPAAQYQPPRVVQSSFPTLGTAIHPQTSMQSTAQSAFINIPHIQNQNMYQNLYQPQALQPMGQLAPAQSLTPNKKPPK